MIYCLTGKIVKKSLNAVVLSCGGVGYYTSAGQCGGGAARCGAGGYPVHRDERDRERCEPVRFATEEQQACFEMLTAVSGVGPKVGLAILSVMEPQRVALAISQGTQGL